MNEAVAAAARALAAQYGDDAAAIAMLRAAEMAAVGDLDALAHWESVLAALEAPHPPSH